MTNLITGMVLRNKKSNKSGYARIGAMALLLFAVLAPFAIQKFLTIDPTIIGLVGIPMIILLGFIGSMTVIVLVPVLPLVFTGAAYSTWLGLVIAVPLQALLRAWPSATFSDDAAIRGLHKFRPNRRSVCQRRFQAFTRGRLTM
jgi:hypothetical protein